jgi:hypothetical protein
MVTRERMERMDKLAGAVAVMHGKGHNAPLLHWKKSAMGTWGISDTTAREYLDELLELGRIRIEGGVVVPGQLPDRTLVAYKQPDQATLGV